MRLSVNVPVLSVQMTDAEPSVSTEVRLRMSTLRLAMRCAASTSDNVSVGSRPSGTMATMMPIAKIRSFQNGTPMAAATAKNSTPIATARTAISRLNRASSLRSGDTVVRLVWARCAICPNSV